MILMTTYKECNMVETDIVGARPREYYFDNYKNKKYIVENKKNSNENTVLYIIPESIRYLAKCLIKMLDTDLVNEFPLYRVRYVLTGTDVENIRSELNSIIRANVDGIRLIPLVHAYIRNIFTIEFGLTEEEFDRAFDIGEDIPTYFVSFDATKINKEPNHTPLVNLKEN